MRELCKSVGLKDKDCTVLSLGPTAVPRYLAAADVGLLPRDENLVNRVASPVKFAEYLASGIPVILSDGIGDYSELVRSGDLGAVLPASVRYTDRARMANVLNGFLSQYAESSVAWRRRCQRVAQESLDWKVHVPRIAAVYCSLSRAQREHAVA
jgi:glycosyltransferase involved in cell wall biosynthesis